MANNYNEITNRLHSTREAADASVNHIVSGADEVYDDVAPYRTNGHIDCTTVTPVGTENPVELRWYERVNYGTEQEPQYEWMRSQDTTVDDQKTYGIPNGAKQSDINNQLYEMTGDTDKVVLYANEYEQMTNPPVGANPQANGWYELSGSTYVLTTDTTVVSGKTYYARVAHISPDENKIVNHQDGYIPTAGAVGRAIGANFEDNLQSTSIVRGLTANMGRVLNETKANKNGWYEQLVSGASLSLIGDKVNGKATFIERETGDSTATGGINHSVDKGTATIDAIYGNTVKFNQLVQASTSAWYFRNSSGTFTISDNSLVLTNLQQSVTGNCIGLKTEFVVGHKYYIRINYTVGSIDSNNRAISAGMSDSPYYYNGRLFTFTALNGSSLNGTVSAIGEVPSEHTDWVHFVIMPRSIANTTTLRYKVEITDLTTLEYPNIATTTPTVAEVETWLVNTIGKQDYYGYDPGSLISLNPNSLVSTGVNLYNPNTGEARVLSGKEYKITGTYTSIEYSDDTTITPSDSIFTASKNDTLTIAGGNNTNTFLYLIENNDTSKTFEPYKESIVDLSWIKDIPDPNDNSKKLFPYGLLCAGNVCDEVRGNKVIKRVDSVDLGTLNWKYQIGRFGCTTRVPLKKTDGNHVGNGVCDSYVLASWAQQNSGKDKSISFFRDAIDCDINIKDSTLSISDIVNGKITKLSGVMLYYELATPIEVTFEEPDTHPMNYEVEDGGIEKLLPENTSTPTTSALVADIRYPLNALDAIRNLQNNFSSQGALYQTFNSLCNALNSAVTTGTFTVAPDETVVGKFNFAFTPTENTQSVESNETI